MVDNQSPLLSTLVYQSKTTPADANLLEVTSREFPIPLTEGELHQSTLKSSFLNIKDSIINSYKFTQLKLKFPCKILKFSPKHSTFLGSHHTDDRLVIFFANWERPDKEKQTGEGAATCMVFNESESMVFIGTATGKLLSFTFPEMKPTMVCMIGNSAAIFDYCPKGFIYVVCTSESVIKAIDINSCYSEHETENSARIIGRFENPKYIKVNKSNKYVAVCSNELVVAYSRDLRWKEFVLKLKPEESTEGNEEQLTCEIEFNAHGDLLAVSAMNYIQLWRTGSWKIERKLQIGTGIDISALRFSNDDDWVIAVGKDHSISIWALDSASTVPKFINKNNPFRKTTNKIYNLEIAEEKNMVITHIRDSDAIFVSKGMFIEKTSFPKSNFLKNEFSKMVACKKKNEVIVLDSENNKVFVWGIESRKEKVIDAKFPIFSIVLSTNEDFLYIGSYEQILQFSTAHYQSREFEMNRCKYSEFRVLVCNDQLIVCGSSTGLILVQLFSDNEQTKLKQKYEISALELNNTRLIVGDIKGSLNIYLLPYLRLHHKFEGHSDQISYIKAFKDCDTLLTVSHDENCMFWSIENLSHLKTKALKPNSPIKKRSLRRQPTGVNRREASVSILPCKEVSSIRRLSNITVALPKVFHRSKSLIPSQALKQILESKTTVDSCFLSEDEKELILSTRDGEIICYNLPGFVIVSVTQFKTGLYHSLNAKGNNTKGMNVDYLYEDLPVSIFQRFVMSPDTKSIIVSNSNGVYKSSSPLSPENPLIFCDCINIPKILRFFKQTSNTERISDIDNWIISPAMVNSLHFYAYEDKSSLLKSAMSGNTPYLNSRIGTPLEISMSADSTETTDAIIRQLKKRVILDIHALETLEGKLVELNLKGFKGLDELYEACLVPISSGVPSTCSGSVRLPMIKYSLNSQLSPTEMIGETEGNTRIAFYGSVIRLNLENGSSQSIEFLESLLKCSNCDIFKTKFIQTILNEKWKKVRWAMIMNSGLYVMYLAVLGAFLVLDKLDRGNSRNFMLLWVCLGLNVLLFLYEVYQMYVDYSSYFRSLWNYIDLSRVGFFYVFMILIIGYEYHCEWVLIVLVVLSWVRGITIFALFNDTRYMIQLIWEVIVDIIPFAIVIMYSIIAFFFINLAVEEDLHAEGNRLDMVMRLIQSYFDSIGKVNYDDYNKMQILLVISSSAFNLIIMMNLLISILRTTYSRVNDNSKIENFKQMTELIIESESLMVTKRNLHKKTFLHICEKYTPLGIVTSNSVKNNMRAVVSVVSSQNKDYYEASERISNEIMLRQERSTVAMQKELGELKNMIEDLKRQNSEIYANTNTPANAEQKCLAGHDLTEIDAAGSSLCCSVCNETLTDFAHNCAICKFYICNSCVQRMDSSKIVTNLTCAAGHQLVHYHNFSEMIKNMHYESQKCRFCNKDIVEKGFHCSHCIFSVCENCSQLHHEAISNSKVIECSKLHQMKWKHKELYIRECLAIRCNDCYDARLGSGFFVCNECPQHICIMCVVKNYMYSGDKITGFAEKNYSESEDASDMSSEISVEDIPGAN